jgi:hypothetical protein
MENCVEMFSYRSYAFTYISSSCAKLDLEHLEHIQWATSSQLMIDAAEQPMGTGRHFSQH